MFECMTMQSIKPALPLPPPCSKALEPADDPQEADGEEVWGRGRALAQSAVPRSWPQVCGGTPGCVTCTVACGCGRTFCLCVSRFP